MGTKYRCGELRNAGWLLAALLIGLSPAPTSADAELVFVNMDGPGLGFNDPSPVDPLAGNPGTSLGEQRKIAFRHALDLWGAELESDVPIEVAASFASTGCLALAGARPVAIVQVFEGEGYVPAALANRLARVDLFPEDPDIYVEFELGHSPGGECGEPLDLEIGDPPAAFVSTSLHELAHGLGFALGDERAPTAFAQHAHDLATGKYVAEMTRQERSGLGAGPRQVVWDGPAATQEAARLLEGGTPSLSTTPALHGLSGLVSDADFSPRSSGTDVTGALSASVGSCALGDVLGRVVLRSAACGIYPLARAAEEAGALGVLFYLPGSSAQAPYPIESESLDNMSIPVLTVSEADAELLAEHADTLSVRLTIDPQHLLGADPQGRLYLHAGSPAAAQPDLSHWDPLVRPNLLMEPGSVAFEWTGLGLARAVLTDIGWSDCGDGFITDPETCDDGPDNGMPGACGSDCEPEFVALCGNGQLEGVEQCDQGPGNSDSAGSLCRMDCSLPGCGDGVLDPGEACDYGPDNDDAASGGCRTDCTFTLCGNWRRDPGEECDEGGLNHDFVPNRCRSDCRLPHCGDGVVDQGEACDEGQPSFDCERCAEPASDAGVLTPPPLDAGATAPSPEGAGWRDGGPSQGKRGGRGEARTEGRTIGPGDAGQVPDRSPPPLAADAGDASSPDAAAVRPSAPAGCGCHLVAARAMGGELGWLALLAGAAAFRRMRRRSE